MNRKTISLIFGLVAIAVVLLALNIQPAKAGVAGCSTCNTTNDNHVEEPVKEPVKVVHPWIRFDSLKGVTGNAGVGIVTFAYKGLQGITSATLHLEGLGDFTLQNISCSGNVCTGEISGLPFGTTQSSYTGNLSVNNGERTCTVSNVVVPPSP